MYDHDKLRVITPDVVNIPRGHIAAAGMANKIDAAHKPEPPYTLETVIGSVVAGAILRNSQSGYPRDERVLNSRTMIFEASA